MLIYVPMHYIQVELFWLTICKSLNFVISRREMEFHIYQARKIFHPNTMLIKSAVITVVHTKPLNFLTSTSHSYLSWICVFESCRMRVSYFSYKTFVIGSSELHIRGAIEDNSWIIFLISL